MKKIEKRDIPFLIIFLFVFFIVFFYCFPNLIISIITYRDFDNRNVRFWFIMFLTFALLLALITVINLILEKKHKQGIIKRIKESPQKLFYFGVILNLISAIIAGYMVLIVPPEKSKDFIPIMLIMLVLFFIGLIFMAIGSSKESGPDILFITLIFLGVVIFIIGLFITNFNIFK